LKTLEYYAKYLMGLGGCGVLLHACPVRGGYMSIEIFVSYALVISGSLSAILIFLVTLAFLPRGELRHPLGPHLRRRKAGLIWAAMLALVATLLFGLAKEAVTHPFILHRGPDTSHAAVATTAAFVLELDEAAVSKRSALVHFMDANSLFEANNYQGAIPEYTASIAAYPTQSAYLNLGIARRFTSAYPDAVIALDTGLKMARDQASRKFEANFLLEQGAVYSSMGMRSDAEKPYIDALNLFHQEHDAVGEADASLGLAVVYRVMGRPEAAALASRAAKLYKNSANVLGLANVALYQGVDKVKVDQCGEALSLFDQALARFSKINHLVGEARARIAIGSCLPKVGRASEGERQLRLALSLATSSGEREIHVAALIALAHLLEGEKKSDEAARDLQDALLLGRQILAPATQQYANLVLADAALNSGNPSSGLENAQEALRLAIGTNDAAGRISALCVTGKLLLKMARPGEALPPLKEAIDRARSLNSIAGNADCLAALGDALSAAGRRAEGLLARQEADSIVRRAPPPVH
jgi:tetratricopeptide (TPR) repeat protein